MTASEEGPESTAAVYHPMLNDEQDQILERLQAQALRCIYGPYATYATMREKAEVTTLIAVKCINSSRFKHWFPLRVSGRSGNRGGDKYLEKYARCDRLKNSPLFDMRR